MFVDSTQHGTTNEIAAINLPPRDQIPKARTMKFTMSDESPSEFTVLKNDFIPKSIECEIDPKTGLNKCIVDDGYQKFHIGPIIFSTIAGDSTSMQYQNPYTHATVHKNEFPAHQVQCTVSGVQETGLSLNCSRIAKAD
jgi:hypothetical protein